MKKHIKGTILGISILALMILMFSSCNFVGTSKFDNEEEAKTYVLQSLQDKYGLEFAIVTSEYTLYESFDITFHKLISGTVSSVDGKYTDIYFRAPNREGLYDNFAKVYYEQPLIDMTDEFLKSHLIENLESYEVLFFLGFPTTNQKWTGKESIEEYIAVENPTVEIRAYFGAGYSAEEYGQQFVDCMKTLTQFDVSKGLRVGITGSHASNIEYFRHEWETPNKNRIEQMTENARGEISNLVNSRIQNPLEEISWIEDTYHFVMGEKDFYWGVGETAESYILRNGLFVEYGVQLAPNLTLEEYSMQTMEILRLLETIPYDKVVKVSMITENNIPYELGAFEYANAYTEKTVEEIAEEYRIAIEAYERGGNCNVDG